MAHGLHKNFPTICFISALALVLVLNTSSILNYPYFVGDSGFRLDHAARIICIWGNRVWLPFLQIHVWALYKCGAPYWAFNFIPILYSLISTLFLGLLIYRILRGTGERLFISVVMMICFSFQPDIKILSLNLYQEVLETAFFYILLYQGMLNLEKKWSLLIIASLALLTRETSFVYLSVITMMNFKRIIRDKDYLRSFCFFWSIPLIWFGYCLSRLRRLPSWPWFINTVGPIGKGHPNSFSNLFTALHSSGVLFFTVAVILMGLLIFYWSKRIKGPGIELESFEAKFMAFSLSSLVIIYSAYLLFDPWQRTFGNERMVMPLLPHVFIWAGIFYKKIDGFPARIAVLLKVLLIACLFSMIVGHKMINRTRPTKGTLCFYYTMQGLGEKYKAPDKPMVCFIGNNYWKLVERFVGPTLYMDRRYVLRNKTFAFEKCDMVIAPSKLKFDFPRFSKYDTLDLSHDKYSIYVNVQPKTRRLP